MVQNLGWFKKIIICKNLKSNDLITIIRVIMTAKKIFKSCLEEANVSALVFSLFHHIWLTNFGPILDFLDNLLWSLYSKRQLQILASYLLDHLHSAAN